MGPSWTVMKLVGAEATGRKKQMNWKLRPLGKRRMRYSMHMLSMHAKNRITIRVSKSGENQYIFNEKY